jgi:hypothetical protein
MKTFARMFCIAAVAAASTVSAFAADTKDNYSYVTAVTTIPDQTTIGSVEVPVPQSVKDWFSSVSSPSKRSWNNGKGTYVSAAPIDGSKIDAPLASLSVAYKDSIDAILNDSDLRDAVTALVNPALKAALVRGQIEVATMRIGRHVFTMSIDGPEDNN